MGILGPFARSAAVVVLAVFGAVAAFATIAPSPDAHFLLSRTSSIEALPIPAEALLPSPASYIREERFQRGDTLAAFLLRLGVSDGEVAPLARQRAFQALRPGYNVAAEVSAEGRLVALSFLTSRDTLVQVSREGEEFRSSEERAALYTQVAMKSTVVQTSLFAASDAAGIPDGVAMQLADIFGGDIDFHRDLRKGDQFAVVYELHHLAGRPVRAGRVLAAEFSSRGKTYRAVHYGNGYYAPDGNSLRQAFLLARQLGRRTEGAPDRQVLARAPGHRLRGPDRYAGAGGGRRSRRARGTAWRLRQHGHPAPCGAVHHGVRASEPHRGKARRTRCPERHHRLCRPDRLGDGAAPALRVSRRRAGAQPDVHRHARGVAGPGRRARRLPGPRRAADRAPRASRQQQPRTAGVDCPVPVSRQVQRQSRSAWPRPRLPPAGSRKPSTRCARPCPSIGNRRARD